MGPMNGMLPVWLSSPTSDLNYKLNLDMLCEVLSQTLTWYRPETALHPRWYNHNKTKHNKPITMTS